MRGSSPRESDRPTDRRTASEAQRSLARVLGELGVRCQVERVTDDGYFSILDIYLPDHDVCVELNGPEHYYRCGDGSRALNFRTALRDFFLAKQCAKVVNVPYFEFAEVETSPESRKMY